MSTQRTFLVELVEVGLIAQVMGHNPLPLVLFLVVGASPLGTDMCLVIYLPASNQSHVLHMVSFLHRYCFIC